MTTENIVNVARNHHNYQHHQDHHQQQHRRQHHHQQQHRKWSHVSVVPVRWLAFWSCVMLLVNAALPEVIYRVDPLALLAATLRTYQRAGCDSEQLSLSCPRGTSISIELAQYGRAGDLSDHSLCPPVSHEDLTTSGSSASAGDGVIHSRTEIEIKPPETCTVSGLQYALLQTVVDACQKKRHCKFSANPKALSSVDPCLGIRKFVEIAYKCRPYEFRSKVACENDNMPLVCNPYSRIAIYSASFGHIERESVQCGHGNAPNNAGDSGSSSKQTCLVSYATETVMQICHGRRRCSVTADAGTFGRPCKHDVRMYLKVVYTCIPRKVLKDRYETAPESDEPQQSELDLDQDELYDEDQFYKESEAIPPAPKLQGAIPNPGFPFDFNLGTDDSSTTLKPPFLSRNGNSNSLEENQEQFYLYLIISVAAGVLLCLTLVVGRLTLQRQRLCRKNSSSSGSNTGKNCSDANGTSLEGGGGGGGGSEKYHQTATGETHLPNSFGDDISDIDADMDLTSPMPVPSLSSRNETYSAYGPAPSCTPYSSMPPPASSANLGSVATTMLMPASHQPGLLMSGHANMKALGGAAGSGTRQPTPPPMGIYTSQGVCSPTVSGPLSIGPHVLTPTALNTVPHHSASYLAGTMMMPGGHHHTHAGTLRRTMIPTSMGLMGTQSPQSANTGSPHAIAGIHTNSGVYYDSTMPRNLSRGLSADNTQYFYG